jgi:hypothetical protein
MGQSLRRWLNRDAWSSASRAKRSLLGILVKRQDKRKNSLRPDPLSDREKDRLVLLLTRIGPVPDFWVLRCTGIHRPRPLLVEVFRALGLHNTPRPETRITQHEDGEMVLQGRYWEARECWARWPAMAALIRSLPTPDKNACMPWLSPVDWVDWEKEGMQRSWPSELFATHALLSNLTEDDRHEAQLSPLLESQSGFSLLNPVLPPVARHAGEAQKITARLWLMPGHGWEKACVPWFFFALACGAITPFRHVLDLALKGGCLDAPLPFPLCPARAPGESPGPVALHTLLQAVIAYAAMAPIYENHAGNKRFLASFTSGGLEAVASRLTLLLDAGADPCVVTPDEPRRPIEMLESLALERDWSGPVYASLHARLQALTLQGSVEKKMPGAHPARARL